MDQHNLALLLSSHFPIVIIETQEERRAMQLLRRIAGETRIGLWQWTAAQGLQHLLHAVDRPLELAGADDEGPTTDRDSLNPEVMLERIGRDIRDSVVVLSDFHPYLEQPRILRLLKEFALASSQNNSSLVLISHALKPPAEIARLCAHFELSLPDADAIRRLLREEARLWKLRNGNQSVKADGKAVELLVRNLVGLTHSDARRFIRNAIYDDGAITHSDIGAVQAAKYKLIDPEGILSFEYDTVGLDQVGGFAALKRWLELRKLPFLQAGSDPDTPKGILLLGVQGGGKSLAARGVAGAWGVPLLRMDFGALYNKYIGETEKNIREALKAAEVLAPCVLWIDEIEKAIADNGSDSGTARRVLGTLLTWMAENKAPVFLVATANDISSLPPELMRKGRLDEIFFVDLPDTATRQEILAIHLARRDHDIDDFDLQQLARASDGFSGAELEQAVVSARYAAIAEGQAPGTGHLLAELKRTHPLSVVMAEPMAELRAWAAGRTVAAH